MSLTDKYKFEFSLYEDGDEVEVISGTAYVRPELEVRRDWSGDVEQLVVSIRYPEDVVSQFESKEER